MTADEQDSRDARHVGRGHVIGTLALGLFALYLLVVDLANWGYLTYKGTKHPETYGEPVLNAVVGLLPLLTAVVAAGTSRRRGRDRWRVLRAAALVSVLSCLVALALASGPGI